MTLQHIIGSIRRYGLRGIINFILSHPKRWSFRHKMAKTLITDPSWTPQPGITIIGNLSFDNSLSKVLRDLAIRLKACDIPCQTLDLSSGSPREKPIPASEYARLLTPAAEFKLNRYSDIIGMLALPPLPNTNCRLSRIEFWEFESGFCEMNPESFDPIPTIAMSDFNVDVFRTNLPRNIPVHKILYPFQFMARTIQPRDVVREKLGIKRDDFVVFFNFNYASCYNRKNPEGLVKAFALAFAGVPGTVLLFKTISAQKHRDLSVRLRTYAKECGIERQLVCVDDYIPQDELVGLTAASNVYCSLHRGEGFGLGIAEAMHLGIPAVVTDYSSTREFCNAENSIPVPYTLVDVKKEQLDFECYKFVKKWAEPDVQAAANALRKLYENPQFRRELGQRAKAFIDNYFSDANFKKSICDFLNRA